MKILHTQETVWFFKLNNTQSAKKTYLNIGVADIYLLLLYTMHTFNLLTIIIRNWSDENKSN